LALKETVLTQKKQSDEIIDGNHTNITIEYKWVKLD